MLLASFTTDESALDASEQAKELDPQATIYVYLPREKGQPVVTVVQTDRTAWKTVSLFGLTLGIFAAAVFITAGSDWVTAALGVGTGISFGILLGLWLDGAFFARRRGTEIPTSCLEQARKGNAVVLLPFGSNYEEDMWRLLQRSGGRILLDPREFPAGGLSPVGRA